MLLEALKPVFFVCRWPAEADVPPQVWESAPVFVAYTDRERSFMLTAAVREGLGVSRCEGPWRGFRIAEGLSFDMVGVLAKISHVLAEAGIPLLAISTFDTDYVWVPAAQWGNAVHALTVAGFAWRK